MEAVRGEDLNNNSGKKRGGIKKRGEGKRPKADSNIKIGRVRGKAPPMLGEKH